MINIINEIKYGLIYGGSFIFLNLLFGFSIGFPYYAYNSLFEKYRAVSFYAPVVEELFFGVAVFFILFFVGSYLFKLSEKSLMLFVMVAGGLIFASYHLKTYAPSFELTGIGTSIVAFVWAGLFGALMNYISFRYNKIPIRRITTHSTINTFLAIKYTGLVVVAQ